MWIFLCYAVGYSLTGVMAPGAITAATLAHGGRNRWAGAWIAVGHGILEIPLIFVLLFGVGGLALAGGVMSNGQAASNGIAIGLQLITLATVVGGLARVKAMLTAMR